jgi:hypothetical protein
VLQDKKKTDLENGDQSYWKPIEMRIGFAFFEIKPKTKKSVIRQKTA